MQPLEEITISCPYCGEIISVLLDEQEVGSEYIEDCQVCCKPIVMSVYHDATGALSVVAKDENDV